MSAVTMPMPVPVAWQPGQEGVEQIVQLLTEYQNPQVNQSQLFAKLQHCSTFPDFNNYLAYILSAGEGMAVDVRQSAGLLLKNNLKTGYLNSRPDFQAYIKSSLLKAIGCPNKQLRTTVGTTISVVAAAGGIPAWPEMSAVISQCLYSDDFNHLEGALDALFKICEEADLALQLDMEVAGLADRPANAFVPRLLSLFANPHPSLRKLAVACCNQLLTTMPPALVHNMDTYLQELFNLRHDQSKDVRKLVCSGLVLLLSVQPERLTQHLREIIRYMIHTSQEADADVALESCEFWYQFCDAHSLNAEFTQVLNEFLPNIIPVLLKNMCYADDDDDLIAAESEAANENVADSDSDIKPFIHTGKGEAEEEGGEEVNAWNLRKCSAAGLDVLSSVYREKLLPIVMPIVQQRLNDPDWKVRESAVLAIGAVAEGCLTGLQPYLGNLLQCMLPLLDDQRPLVRSIACWAISRFSKSIIDCAHNPPQGAEVGSPQAQAAIQQGQAQLDHVLMGLLKRVLDGNKRVQEAACSAVATLEEEAGVKGELNTRVEPILKHLMAAFSKYQRKNLRILYDALGTLADAVGATLNNPQYVQLLVPALLQKWEQLGEADRDVFPLLECITSVAQALGPFFADYGETVFNKCILIVQQQLHFKMARFNQMQGMPPPQGQAQGEYEKEFVVCALDLLCVLVEVLGPSVESLVSASPIGEMLLVLCNDEAPDVRQSAFELIGDLSRVCAPHLAPHAKELFQVAAANLAHEVVARPENMSACNNACWAIGELAVKVHPDAVRQYMSTIVHCLAPLLSDMTMPNKSLLENSTITIGRLGWVCPEQVASQLPHFMVPWCQALRGIRDDVEKEHAFLGMCAMLHANPSAGLNAFPALCEAVASWRILRNTELQNEMGKILRAYKDYMKDDWTNIWGSINQGVCQKLQYMYGDL